MLNNWNIMALLCIVRARLMQGAKMKAGKNDLL